jgi:general nucleoside transport system permease protein
MDFLVNWLSIVPQFAVPFALATLGLLICEKSGVLNLGAEGFMLMGAMAGAGATLVSGEPYFGLLVAALAAGLIALLFAFLVITIRVNQVISGLTMVFLAQGLTTLVSTQMEWTNKAFTGVSKMNFGVLSDIPIVGRFIFEQDVIVYFSILLFAAAVYVFDCTEIGLRIKAVGENPEAADSAGVSVPKHRFLAVVVGCMLVGLAGGYISVVVSKIWVDGMSGGRGWIAIALVIFARWRFWTAMSGAVLFGCVEALIPRVAAIGLEVPQYFVLMLPYIATLTVMIWASLGKNSSGAPGALGKPFVREERT